MKLEKLKEELRRCGDKEQAKLLQRYFKTGPGEYAEGDRFLGIKVPVLRGLVKRFGRLPLRSALELLRSPVHEERLVALLSLIELYRTEEPAGKEKVYKAYLAHTRFINNWDLVDVSAKSIVGAFLMDRDRAPLYTLARSRSLWEKRIAVVATFYFISRDDFRDSLKIGAILMNDRHDLIHKAVGWMLRELGKKDQRVEEEFLKKYCAVMPRTMLRYAIERFPASKRQAFLKGSR
jgi:3-methyladenine DNA glycosylase AlkD